MKRLLIILLSLGLVVSASAQHVHGGAYYRPRVIVGVGAGFGPMFYPYGFYSPFYPYGPYYNGYHRPSKLDMKIEDIRNDYKDRIWSVKHDKTITRKERRQKVREMKHERDQAIYDAKHNYYRSPK